MQKLSEARNGTPLHLAASEGHVLISHVLVQAGAELDAIDDEHNTPLMLACVKGKANVVRYLLAAGSDLTLRGEDGMTCLHLVSRSYENFVRKRMLVMCEIPFIHSSV